MHLRIINRIRFTVIIGIMLLFSIQLTGQNLKDYKWKNRVVLVISDDKDSDIFKAQVEAVENDEKGLKERKLIIFKILPSKFQLNSDKWVPDSKLYRTYNKDSDPFKIVLIGLDGGVKLSRDTLISKNELYDLIDSMPMRSAELKNKN